MQFLFEIFEKEALIVVSGIEFLLELNEFLFDSDRSS